MNLSFNVGLANDEVNGMKSSSFMERKANPNSPQFYCGGHLVQPVESVGYSPTNPNFSNLMVKGKEAWAMIPIMYMIEELIGGKLRIIKRDETLSRITEMIEKITHKQLAGVAHSSHISEHDEVGDQYSPNIFLKEEGYQRLLEKYADFMEVCKLKPTAQIEHLGFEMRDIQILEQIYTSMAVQVFTVMLCHMRAERDQDRFDYDFTFNIFNGYNSNPFQKTGLETEYAVPSPRGLATSELDIVTLSHEIKVSIMSKDGTKRIAFDKATMSPDPNDSIHDLLMQGYEPYNGSACHIIDVNASERVPKGEPETIGTLEDSRAYASEVRGLEPRFPPPLPGE